MIRLVIVLLFVVLFLIISLPIQFVEWLIGKKNMNLKMKSSLAIVNWAFRVVLFLSGTKVTILGEENVPKDTAVVYVPNHRSFFDIIITYTRVPRLTGYIAKKEIEKVPGLNIWMRYLNCLFLDRSNPKEGLKTILQGIDKLKNGISICIFPEGTRNKQADTFLEFKDASFKLAEKSGCPVVPISIVNSAAIFEDHFPKIKKAHVVVEYGKPVYVKDLEKEDRKNIGSYFQKQISDLYFKNKELYFENTAKIEQKN